jgi:hypothetical protein
MPSRISRYRKLPDVVIPDARGRARRSKDLRVFVPAAGALLHTVEGADRLDHLAFKYYRQPRKWWRICDGNPEVFSPQALLGKEPLLTARFSLTVPGAAAPPWTDLRRRLARVIGVEDVRVVEEVRIEPEVQIVAGQPVTVEVERFTRALVVTWNRMTTDPAALAAVMIAAGVVPGEPELLGRVGKPIVIPPDVVG